MDSSVALLTQLVSLSQQGGVVIEGAHAAFAATAQLGLLAAAVRQQSAASELADEIGTRAKSLLGSKQAAGKRLGLHLLHGAVSECDRATFLASHGEWASLLITLLRNSATAALATGSGSQGGEAAPSAHANGKPSTGSSLPASMQAAAWDCLAALHERLPHMLGVPGVRRDAAAATPKLVSLLLLGQQKQQQQAADGVGVGQPQAMPPMLKSPAAQRALLAALTALPVSFRQQQKSLEGPLLALLLQPAGPAGQAPLPQPQQQLAAALVASLPRIQGDADSWSQLLQRLLVTAHCLLDVVYLSLEDQGLSQAARAACDPAAVPLTAGTAAVAGAIAKSSGGVDAYMARLGQLSAVLEAVAQLLCRSYPAAVPLPSSALLLLASRLLSLDDSAMRAAAAAGSAARFAQLCWHLPALHAAALRLLTQLLATGGSQLAPLFIAAARMIADLLQGCAAAVAAITITGGSSDSSSGALVPTVAAVRCWLYATARQLLLVGGAGVVRPLAPAVLAAARSELYGRQIQQQQQHEGVGIDGDLPALDAEPVRKKARKGKQQQQAGSGGVAAGSADQLNIGAAPNDDQGAARQQGELAAQAAVLGLLGGLLSGGAALLSPADRTAADDMAAHMASSAAAACAATARNAEAAASQGQLQLLLASHRALLAAVLAPAPHRPRHLATALVLFRHGRLASCPQLVAFCAHALLCLEALLHPRAVPPLAAGGPAASAAAGVGPSAAMPPQPLGQPRFWSAAVGGGGWGATEQPRQQQQQQVAQELGPADVAMLDAQEHQPAATAAAPAAAAPARPVLKAGRPGLSTLLQQQELPQAPGPNPAPAAQLAAPGWPAGNPSHPGGVAAAKVPAPSPPAAALAANPAVPSVVPMVHAPPPAPLTASTAQPALAASAAVAAAAAAEESDSDDSLPDIDSGPGESDSSSADEEGAGRE